MFNKRPLVLRVLIKSKHVVPTDICKLETRQICIHILCFDVSGMGTLGCRVGSECTNPGMLSYLYTLGLRKEYFICFENEIVSNEFPADGLISCEDDFLRF